MKSCPSCHRTYTDASLNFCLEDGTPLVAEAAPVGDLNATIQYIDPRDTSARRGEDYLRPPVSPAYGVATEVRPTPQLSPQSVSASPGKKSNVLWWVIGGVIAVGIIAVGLVIMILALNSMSTNANLNGNAANSNSRGSNRNATTATNTNGANINSSANLPPLVTDDFSAAKWGTGKYPFGEIWYADGAYHMRSKEKTYLVMYAPSDDYNTGNATTRVKARSVDGTPAASGFGLIVHGEKSKNGELEDYALLIYTGSDPQYEIIKHKAGTQTTVVPWTKSGVILTGTSPNELEVRAKGSELSFYINGEYVDRITDSENFKRGVAGFYSSDTAEVAFDDLEIKR
ncbi:MAG: hypothetical protein M3R67_10455 [Acidobacteriota bacterium]|nr:hypothetical protein [Acidobacteriota bacterium]